MSLAGLAVLDQPRVLEELRQMPGAKDYTDPELLALWENADKAATAVEPEPEPQPEPQQDGEAAPGEGPMDDDELQSVMHGIVSDAVNFVDSELSPDRALATKYYQGKPFGNEEEGRSQVVMTEVRDTVLSIMPSLLRVFWGAERMVEFGPQGPEDVAAAEQATDFISRVVMGEDNPGFLTFHAWFQDALVRKIGTVKWWWDDTNEAKTYRATVASSVLDTLVLDENVELLRVREQKQPYQAGEQEEQVFEVEYKQTRYEGRARFQCVPPEEFGFNRDARSLDEALVVFHRTEKTRSELVAMGVPADVIDAHGGKSSELDQNEEEIARQPGGLTQDTETGDEANDRILWIEAYPFVDYDGDGEAELRRVRMIGPSYHIVDHEPWDERPFAMLCPYPEAHTIVGQSTADLVMDLQKITSMLARSMLDSLALAIHPRTWFVEGEVNVQDVMNTEMGSPIRARAPGMVGEFGHAFVGREALGVLDWVSGVKENRSGMSRAAAGLNPDALQSSTKAAVAATVTKAQEHVEMIARIFAETGVKRLMKGLLKLVNAHQPRARMVRLRGQFVEVDPRAWDVGMDVIINVALGAGLTEEKVALLAEIAAKQEQILQLLGPTNPLVTLAQYRNTLARMVELRGEKDSSRFFQPVDPNWQPPQAEPQPDPNMMIAQAEMEKAKAEVAKKQADMQVRQIELQAALQQQGMELELKRETMKRNDDLERDRLDADIALKARELELKYQAEVDTAKIQAEIDRDREAMRNEASVQAEHVRAGATVEAARAKKPTSKEITSERDDKGNLKMHMKEVE